MKTKYKSRLNVDADEWDSLSQIPQDLMKCAIAMVSNQKAALGPKKRDDLCSNVYEM